MKVLKKTWLLFISVYLLVSCNAQPQSYSVILMIGDGMGPQQQKAASLYLYGEDGKLSFQSFPVKTEISTYSADSSVTDSAASATAMATGTKVNNGVISRTIPGDGSDLETVLEAFGAEGKSTGIVTTAFVTHATPAAFTAHADSREDYSKIAEDLFTKTMPNVIFGGGGTGYGIDPAFAEAQGYDIALNTDELDSLSGEYSAGLFGDTHIPYEYDGLGVYPHLHDMAVKAVQLLEDEPDGFFLMIEGGRIDHACHANDIKRAVYETVGFSEAVKAVYELVKDRNDVLLIVTSDHETGGLEVTVNNGAGAMPGVSWSTTGHTGINVPLYAWGYGASGFGLVTDNSELKNLF